MGTRWIRLLLQSGDRLHISVTLAAIPDAMAQQEAATLPSDGTPTGAPAQKEDGTPAQSVDAR